MCKKICIHDISKQKKTTYAVYGHNSLISSLWYKKARISFAICNFYGLCVFYGLFSLMLIKIYISLQYNVHMYKQCGFFRGWTLRSFLMFLGRIESWRQSKKINAYVCHAKQFWPCQNRTARIQQYNLKPVLISFCKATLLRIKQISNHVSYITHFFIK